MTAPERRLAEELRNIARSCGKEDTSSVLSLVRVTVGKLSKERDALAARLEEAEKSIRYAVELLEGWVELGSGRSEMFSGTRSFLALNQARLEALEKGE